MLFIFQGNVIIVDTPGIGDEDQEVEARMMLDYIQNALAIVFVLNVSNAGGVQQDRVFYNFVINLIIIGNFLT